MYIIVYSERAQLDMQFLKRHEPSAFKKAVSLIKELSIDPRKGTGKPEKLTGNLSGYWSRRITRRHRLVYEIKDDRVEVCIVSSYGHYEKNK